MEWQRINICESEMKEDTEGKKTSEKLKKERSTLKPQNMQTM